MIILDAKIESVVQVGDMFRLDCTRSHFGDQEGSIKATIGGDEYDMPEMILDLAFDEAGEKEITITAQVGEENKELIRNITVLSKEDDRLFSSDEDLAVHEETIFELLRPGKKSFKNIHRLAQQEILRELNEKYPHADLTKNSLVKITQVRAWSKYLTLHYIFESNVSSIEDFHAQKSRTYLNLAKTARNNVPIALDLNGDGKEDTLVNLRSIGLRL